MSTLNYNPDKTSYFDPNKEWIKIIAEEGKKYKKMDFNQFWETRANKEVDYQSISKRTQSIIDGSAEKNAMETLKKFDANQITTQVSLAQHITEQGNNFKRLKEAQIAYNNGTLSETLKNEVEKNQKIDENAMKSIIKEEKELKDLFDNYVILGTKSVKEKGFAGLVLGNKKTGKIDLMFCGTNIKNKAELKSNMITYSKTSPSQEAALEFAKEVQNKIKNGEFKGYNELDCIIGHSKGGGEAIYVASNLKGTRAIASDPGMVVKPGPYLKDNNILVIVPNNGNGTFNYADPIPGSYFTTLHPKSGKTEGNTFNKLSMLTSLAVPKSEMSNPKYYNYRNHFPDAEKTAEKLKEMQEYCKQVEPIYNNYWSQKRNETNKKDLSQLVNKEKTEKVTVKREPSSKFKQLVK